MLGEERGDVMGMMLDISNKSGSKDQRTSQNTITSSYSAVGLVLRES